jgi:uncharacterized protein DUF4190/HAAS domain-containing protein
VNVNADPLVEDYLRHLEAVASGLPAYRREELLAEIRAHLAEAMRQVPPGDQAAVRSVLERLGSPEEIVAAAADPMPPGPFFPVPVPATNGLAIASLLFGIFWLGGIGSLAALVLGYRARREIRRSAGGQRGDGLATIGIVLGWIGLAALVLAAVAVFVLLSATVTTTDPSVTSSVAPVPSG